MSSAPFSPHSTIRLIATDIKLAHSLFAMPFAILAAFMAAHLIIEASKAQVGRSRYIMYIMTELGGRVLMIVLAMILARTAAMLANRLVDRDIDAANPRTASRALPSGQLLTSRAIAALIIAAAGFLLVCAGFGLIYKNWWPLILGPAILVWICAYPLLKRFTVLCHLYLGSSLAISPLAAAIAIDPASIAPWSPYFQPALWLLSAMVLCWVAGFDIIYALQDVEIDRKQGLFSIPSRFGVPKALWISRALHALAVACLFASLWIDPRLSFIFGASAAIVAALLIYEHLTVARWGTTKIALAFFTLNGVISCVLGALGVIDLLIV